MRLSRGWRERDPRRHATNSPLSGTILPTAPGRIWSSDTHAPRSFPRPRTAEALAPGPDLVSGRDESRQGGFERGEFGFEELKRILGVSQNTVPPHHLKTSRRLGRGGGGEMARRSLEFVGD